MTTKLWQLPLVTNQDTYITNAGSASNFYTDSQIRVGRASSRNYRALFLFNVSAALSESPAAVWEESNAYLEVLLRLTLASGPAAFTMDVLTPETLTFDITQATWASASTGVPWLTAGAGPTFPAGVSHTFAGTESSGDVVDVNLTLPARAAYENDGGVVGLILKHNTESPSNELARFHSADATDETVRPVVRASILVPDRAPGQTVMMSGATPVLSRTRLPRINRVLVSPSGNVLTGTSFNVLRGVD